MALTVMQLLIASNGKKEKREKRTSVQYSITQIDTDKAIVEIVLFLFFLSLRSYQTEFKYKESKRMQKDININIYSFV
jgi:hypothetical protein